MKKIQLAAALLLLSGPAALGQIRTWVSPNGLDSNPCTLQEPCRNFNAAIAAVAPGGEVVALGSAGYGAIFTDKSVNIIAPEGVHAAIAPTSGYAIWMLSDSPVHVVIRNLYLNSQGGNVGIRGEFGVASLHVENCVVSGFANGIIFRGDLENSLLFVSDTLIRGATIGIVVSELAGTDTRATINSVRLQQNDVNGMGVFLNGGSEVTIRNTVATGGSVGFRAQHGSKMTIENSVATGHHVEGFGSAGFLVDNSGVMILNRCTSTLNRYGIRTESNGTAYVSNSTITANGTGILPLGGVASSRGNNTVQGNTDNGAFNGTFTPN